MNKTVEFTPDEILALMQHGWKVMHTPGLRKFGPCTAFNGYRRLEKTQEYVELKMWVTDDVAGYWEEHGTPFKDLAEFLSADV
jgi:hypothetical protein